LAASAKASLSRSRCEYGGEPSWVEFCHIVGMDYVSCSPYRVPIARLAAAQAKLQYPCNLKRQNRFFRRCERSVES